MLLGYAIAPASCYERRPMNETNAVSGEHRLYRDGSRVKMYPSLASQLVNIHTAPLLLRKEGHKALSIGKLERPDKQKSTVNCRGSEF